MQEFRPPDTQIAALSCGTSCAVTPRLSAESESVFGRLCPGSIAIDCGANVGVVTERMARTGAAVVAFEPHPLAFTALKNRFAGWSNVFCLPYGVAERDRRARLYLHKDWHKDPLARSESASCFVQKLNVDPTASIEVELIALARFIRSLSRNVDLLKIDIEGLECAVINHLIDEGLTKDIQLIVAETHEQQIPGLAGEVQALKTRVAQEKLTQINLNWV